MEFLPDGRSVVATVGGRRFRVRSRGDRDGYATAGVEFIADDKPSDTDHQAIAGNDALELLVAYEAMIYVWRFCL